MQVVLGDVSAVIPLRHRWLEGTPTKSEPGRSDILRIFMRDEGIFFNCAVCPFFAHPLDRLVAEILLCRVGSHRASHHSHHSDTIVSSEPHHKVSIRHCNRMYLFASVRVRDTVVRTQSEPFDARKASQKLEKRKEKTNGLFFLSWGSSAQPDRHIQLTRHP